MTKRKPIDWDVVETNLREALSVANSARFTPPEGEHRVILSAGLAVARAAEELGLTPATLTALPHRRDLALDLIRRAADSGEAIGIAASTLVPWAYQVADAYLAECKRESENATT